MTKHRRRPALSLLMLPVLCLAGVAAQAQSPSIWRCGADGRSYSDSPCAEGRAVAVADARTAAELADARAVWARDQRLARQQVAERQAREREARARGSGLAGIRAGGAVKPAAPPTASERWRRPSTKPRPPAGAETSPAAVRGSRQMPG